MAINSAGRIVAIDLGKARVGIAISDDLEMLAHPRPALDGRNHKRLLGALQRMAVEEGVRRFLVGLPLKLDGSESPASRRVLRFCQALADLTGIEVELVDERLTSVQAQRRLKEGGVAEVQSHIDGAAAAILLQQWLDAQTRR